MSFDFDYYRPQTLEEAIACFQDLTREHQKVLYYSGGTEIISMARADNIAFDAVIDLKDIPECQILDYDQGNYVIGSVKTLTSIVEKGVFPLLCKTIARIADHTMQDKITIGGNLGSTIIYRESSLPFMITKSYVKIMTLEGIQTCPFHDVWEGRLKLKPEEFIVQILIDIHDLDLPYVHVKRTKMDKIDYPLITLVANQKDNCIQAAVTGVSHFPIQFSTALLNASLSEEDIIIDLINQIDHLIINDLQGSQDYRKFVLSDILSRMFRELKDGVVHDIL